MLSLPSVQSAICTDERLYSYMPVRTGCSSICIVIRLYCHPSVLLSVSTVALLNSCQSVQFSACTVIHSLQCAICTDGCLYSYLSVHLVLVIFLYSHPSVCTVFNLYSCLFCLPSVQIDACTDGQLYRQDNCTDKQGCGAGAGAAPEPLFSRSRSRQNRAAPQPCCYRYRYLY